MKIQSALTTVNELLAMSTVTRKPVVMASAKRVKILAMLGVGSKPNLRLLNKMINRGAITTEEVVNAVGEALLLRRVNRRVVEAIVAALRETLGSGDVIDVDEAA
jgi:hypothetical protein